MNKQKSIVSMALGHAAEYILFDNTDFCKIINSNLFLNVLIVHILEDMSQKGAYMHYYG